jgi:hypothetical protein
MEMPSTVGSWRAIAATSSTPPTGHLFTGDFKLNRVGVPSVPRAAAQGACTILSVRPIRVYAAVIARPPLSAKATRTTTLPN